MVQYVCRKGLCWLYLTVKFISRNRRKVELQDCCGTYLVYAGTTVYPEALKRPGVKC